ncbi:MAG: HNH endonuclease signature motif containing protein [Nitrososphaeraceae archaeon]|nr:HNH endonuclease signature motif containing protein [Nitrososphaeraceae archaeon]
MSSLTITFPRVPKSLNYYYEYEVFISLRKQRQLKKQSGCQIHHIIPKCLNGSDDKSNLVLLTHSEHFTAHYLLANMYPKHFGLQLAIINMTKHVSNSFEYQQIMERVSKMISARMAGIIFTDGHIKNLCKAQSKRWDDDENRRSQSIALLEFYENNPNHKDYLSKVCKQYYEDNKDSILKANILEREQRRLTGQLKKDCQKGQHYAAKSRREKNNKILNEFKKAYNQASYSNKYVSGKRNPDIWGYYDLLFTFWKANGCPDSKKFYSITQLGNGPNSLKTIIKTFKDKI